MPATRQEVYAALDSERAYQDQRWDAASSPHPDSVEAGLFYMLDYIDEARRLLTRQGVEVAKPEALNILRKITAIGVRWMEHNGAPRREGF